MERRSLHGSRRGARHPADSQTAPQTARAILRELAPALLAELGIDSGFHRLGKEH